MVKALLVICVALAALLQLSQARLSRDFLNDELNTELEVENDDDHPEPTPNKACHCENSSCSCCVTEFKKRICSSLDFIEKVDEDKLLVRVNLTINDKQVLSQKFSTDSVPPLCYSNGPLGVCVKLNVRKKEEINVCASLQLRIQGELKREYDLYCLALPIEPNNNEEISSSEEE